MPHLDLDLDLPPLVTASVLLAARHLALASGISWPDIEDILAATGASPEVEHASADMLLDRLAALAVMAKRQSPSPDLAGLDHGADGPAVSHLDLDLDLPPLVTASVLLAARHFALASGISWPGIEDIRAATGASPEVAHEIEDALLDQLAALAKRQPPPPDLASGGHNAELLELAVAMLRFIQQNPGCAQSGEHERYTDSFLRFVLELRQRYAERALAGHSSGMLGLSE